MTPDQYKKFQQELKQSQERAQLTIARMDKTIAGVKQTIEQIQQNQRNIDNMKKYFNDVMDQLAEKLSITFGGNPFKKVQGRTYEHYPSVKPAKEVIKAMLNYKQILIVTGAGVSAPSGIPTFRGKNGLYSKKFTHNGKQYEPEEFITKSFYSEYPDPIWQWIQQIYKMSTTLKHNNIHQLIDKLARVLSVRGKKVTVVTQNIDDMHLKPKKEEYEYYAVHGNVKQVRCDNDHLHNYENYRKEITTQAKRVMCPKCNEPLRPHVLFFDQSYGPLYGGAVKDKEFPFVILIGTSLSTGLCSKLAMKAKEIVEINPQPVIEVGKVYQFKKETGQTLSEFLKILGQSK